MAQTLEIVGLDVMVFTENGACPGKILEGGDAGPCTIVVFGMKQEARGPERQFTRRVAASVLEAVPHSSEKRSALYPHWEHAGR